MFSFEIKPLNATDISDALTLEQAAYKNTPPQKDYHRELLNPNAHYLTLHLTPTATEPSHLIGVAGMWLTADELHVMTIAIAPRWKRQGLGEYLLIALLETGIEAGAQQATLEVRPSNRVALMLYQKYGFTEIGRRSGYYRDTGEDALILSLLELTSTAYQATLNTAKLAIRHRLEAI